MKHSLNRTRTSPARRLPLTRAFVAPLAAATLAVSAGPTPSPSAAATPAELSTSSKATEPPDLSKRAVVAKWAAAWNGSDPAGMAALFTAKGKYQDFAFEAAFEGREGVASWVNMTSEAIDDVHVKVDEVLLDPNRAAVRWTFSGHFVGAPTKFSVPVFTVIETTNAGKIRYLGDYYNRADVLAQSGLPLDMVFE